MQDILTNKEKWCNDWKRQGWLSTYIIKNRYIAFRTNTLDMLFPITKAGVEGWVCYYIFECFPVPTRAFIQFQAERFDKDTTEKYNVVNPFFRRNNRKAWKFHRLESWSIDAYSDEGLKIELERIILDVIPKFEKQVKSILERDR